MSMSDANPFARVLIRPVSSGDALHGALFHLWWSAPEQGDRVVQVYANDRLHDVVLDPSRRDCWLVFAPGQPMRIELRAVAIEDAYVMRPITTPSEQPTDWAAVMLLRDPALPVGAIAGVAVDDAAAEFAPLFGVGDARNGFGAVFGGGGFGIDAATGPGLGRGALGLGPLGTDGEPWRWRRDDLSAGAHELTITLQDDSGQALADPYTDNIDIERLPVAPLHVAVDSELTLSWS